MVEREPFLFADPDALPRVLSRGDALALGMSRHAIDRRIATLRWRRVLPRTYLRRDTMTELDRYQAALKFAGKGAALSGAAALRLSEVPKLAEPRRVLVLVPPSNRTRSTSWVAVRRTFRPFELEQWIGPDRVGVPRAVADHALTLRRIDDVPALVARSSRPTDGRSSIGRRRRCGMARGSSARWRPG